ncbi:MAG: amidase family protein [Gammaproteobacteria bacterium]|nr:amidase family protein [Gammaproteobacteria bacterium]
MASLVSDITQLGAVELAQAIRDGHCTAVEAVRAHLDRIHALDHAGPRLNAVLETNPDALASAAGLDARLARTGPLGPLHGVPVLIKANIDTAEPMATSAGSRALANHRAQRDAPVIRRLRAAGAVLIGTTNLSEWANFRSARSIDGWSSLGGQTRNPYRLDHSPSGSSSGSAVAVAVRLAPLAVGTETDGSIISPASVNGVVGIKPTSGVVDAHGIIPIAASLDSAGPLARTVRDAGALLAAMARPTALLVSDPPLGNGSQPMRHVRIGVLRGFGDADWPEELETAVAALRELGADVVDPVTIAVDDGWRDAERQLLLHEFNVGLNRYLRQHQTDIANLAELIAYNESHAAEAMPAFGQDLFEAAATGSLERRAYAAARESSIGAMRRALADVFAAHALRLLLVPAGGPAHKIEHVEAPTVSSSSIAALSGYPSLALPWTLIDGLPVAVALVGKPFTEVDLLATAAACETARGPFPPPTRGPL